MKKTRKLTFAAVSCALSLALLYFTSLIQTGTLATQYIVGIVLMLTVSQSGIFYGICAYAVTGILCLVLLPDKSVAISYLIFFGSIPLLKFFAEKCGRILEWIIKIIFINIFIFGIYYIFRSVLASYSIPLIYPWIVAFITGIGYDVLLSFGFSFAISYFKKNP